MTADYAADFVETLGTRPIREQASVEELYDGLAGPLPEAGLEPEGVIASLVEAASPGLVGIPAGRYFGFVIGGGVPAAVAADWLASAWDQNAGGYVIGNDDERRRSDSEQPQRTVDGHVPLRAGDDTDGRRSRQAVRGDVPAGLLEHVVPRGGERLRRRPGADAGERASGCRRLAEVCVGSRKVRMNVRSAIKAPKGLVLSGKSKSWAGGGVIITEANLAAARTLLASLTSAPPAPASPAPAKATPQRKTSGTRTRSTRKATAAA